MFLTARKSKRRKSLHSYILDHACHSHFMNLWHVICKKAIQHLIMDLNITHSRQDGVNFVSKQITGCILMGTQNPSKWGIYHENLTKAFWDMVTLMSGQGHLVTTLIHVFCDIFPRLWNMWTFLTRPDQFWWLKIQICDQNR